MQIQDPGIYHIYNRGNNKQPIFFNKGNYTYFLNKCGLYLKPVCSVLAWCLMPNHFHFLIAVDDKSLTPVRSGAITMPAIANNLRLLLSAYSKGINKQQGRKGNLFQQGTKSKLVSNKPGYALNGVNYIHMNPVKAGLSFSPGDWPYSSYNEYQGKGIYTLCDRERCFHMLDITAGEIV